MKYSKKIYTVITSLAIGSLLVSCASNNSKEQNSNGELNKENIIIGSLYEPQNLDNTGGGGQGVTEALSSNVYESLVQLQDDGSTELNLAEEITRSEDGLSYTVKIHDNVKFHSGEELTATDVKFSYERVLAEESQAARKNSYKVVSEIETPDDQTVIFKLSKPAISFEYLLSYIWIVNDTLKDAAKEEDGTGPYTLESFKRGSSLSLSPWKEYWGDKPKNSGVEFRYFSDASALSNALLTNAVDIVTSVQSPDALSQFESNDNYFISEGNSTTKELLAFNDRKEPFNNAKLRVALYKAIDREKLLDAIWGDYGLVIGSMVPPQDPWYEDYSKLHAYNVKEAKSELNDLGYGSGLKFTLDTPSYDPHPTVAEFIKSELAKVDVEVTINIISSDEWYSKVFKEKNFEATLQEHVNDRDIVWYGNPDFYWGYNNPEVTKLVSEAESASSLDEQTEKLKEVNKIVSTDAASLWLYLYPQIVISDKDLKGYWVNGLNSQFPVANIEFTK